MSQVITLEQLNDYSTSTVDPARGQLIVDAVNDYVFAQTGRSWGVTAVEVTETFDWAPVIFLKHYPVTGISSITYGRPGSTPTTIPAANYYVNDIGRLVLSESRSAFGPSLRDRVTITYTHGSADIPADLTLAALSMAADMATFADSGQKEVSSEGVGSYRLTYASVDQSSAGKVYNSIIKRYAARDL